MFRANGTPPFAKRGAGSREKGRGCEMDARWMRDGCEMDARWVREAFGRVCISDEYAKESHKHASGLKRK